MVDGASPQLQECDLEVSNDGAVRLLAIQPIFLKGTGWLFYDFTKPSFCNKTSDGPYVTSCKTPARWLVWISGDQ